MAQHLDFIRTLACMRRNIFSLLSIVIENISDTALFLLFEEDEDDELFFHVVKTMKSTNFSILMALKQGNQYPPPKQDTLLFPDFIASHFPGRDLLANLTPRPYLLYDMTGETVQ